MLSKGVLPHGGHTSVKLQDKWRATKSRKSEEPTISDQQAATTSKVHRDGSVPHTHMRNYQKPWPSGKSSGSGELVRHMSHVPCYLQRVDRGNDLQEKALNVGVLDWGRLEKWACDQKSLAKRRHGDFPASTIISSPFSTCGSSSESCTSSSSALSQRRQAPSLNCARDTSAECCQTPPIEQENSTHSMRKHEKGRRKHSDPQAISSSMSQHPGCGTSETSNREKAHTSKSTEAEKPQYREVQVGHCNPYVPEDWPQDECADLSENVEGMWDHLREDVPWRSSTFQSTALKDASPEELKCNDFSGNYLPGNFQLIDLSSQVPHSCPLPSSIEGYKPEVASTSPYENGVSATMLKCKHKNANCPTGFPCESLVNVSMGDRLGQDKKKASTLAGRGLSPSRRSSAVLNWMSRSSSLPEGSLKQQMKRIACSDNVNEDRASANSGQRESLMRRILDPLLKPMNRISFSGQIAGCHVHEAMKTDKPLIQEESRSTQGPHKLSDENTDASSNPQGSLQEMKHRGSTRRALLQLAWKNGLPLFMLSSNDSDILAATIRKRDASLEDDVECIYTIFFVREVKKKSGIWMNSGSRNHGLVSNIVGHIKVSCPKLHGYDLHGHSVTREVVLFGAELAPTLDGTVDPDRSSQLASIIVKNPTERLKSLDCDMPKIGGSKDSTQHYSAERNCCNYHAESLKMELDDNNSSFNSILAILPSAVHGLSAEGEPSPLIERWKSGGSCDCGGWDEGCTLTILCDKLQEGKNSFVVRACDGTQRLELFVQGKRRERQVFSILAFKEGLYTVDFEPSIALLQAFAIGIAALHSWRTPNHSRLHSSMEAKSLEEGMFADHARLATPRTQGEGPASYVPNHSPLSPFGRA